MSEPKKPTLSIVIPSYRSPNLGRVLEPLLTLGVEEIIVVDSSSETPTFADPRVRVIARSERTLPGHARNIGAKAARGEYLLFVDADVLFTARSIDFVERFMQAPSDGPICGTYDLEFGEDNFYSRTHNLILSHRFADPRSNDGPRWAPSSHFIVRRPLFLDLGGFHEELRTHEDNEFFLRCAALGHPVQVAADFTAAHLKPYSFRLTLLDYSSKVFGSVRARGRNRAVFARGGPQVGALIGLSWLSGALLPIFAFSALFSVIAPEIALVLSGATFLAPTALWLSVLRPLPVVWKLMVPLFWPFLGTTIAASYGLATLQGLGDRLNKFVVGGLDFLRALGRVVLKTGMPVQVINFVTAKCNLRCAHCFYIETLDKPDPGELSLEVLDKTTQEVGPLLWYAFGGGEIYLRKDLPELVKVIQRNCRPKVMSVPSNGWYVDKTYETTLRILQGMEWGDFVLMISIDGPEAVHDAVRGKGSFERAKETFHRLRALQEIYPHFNLTVTTTVQPNNAKYFPEFVDELVETFSPRGISINLFRYHALEHPPIPDEVLEAYRRAVLRYEEHVHSGKVPHYGFFGSRFVKMKDILQKELIYRVAKENEFVTPCTSGTLSYVIWEDGRVGPCEVLSDDIGRIGEGTSFRDLIRSKRAKELRGWVAETECKCTYECAQGNNTLFSWPMTKQVLRGIAGTRRLEL